MTTTQTSTTGEKCARCGDHPERVDLTPGDGFCSGCFETHVEDELAEIEAAIKHLANYVDNEDPQLERLSDRIIAKLNEARR